MNHQVALKFETLSSFLPSCKPKNPKFLNTFFIKHIFSKEKVIKVEKIVQVKLKTPLEDRIHFLRRPWKNVRKVRKKRM